MEIKTIELKQTDIPRRETSFKGFRSYIAVDSQGYAFLTVKTRITESGRAHAQVFVNGDNALTSKGYGCGYGYAGGYGYDKESAAVENALEKAGVRIDGLSGTGQTRQAVEQVAKALNSDFLTVIETWH